MTVEFRYSRPLDRTSIAVGKDAVYAEGEGEKEYEYLKESRFLGMPDVLSELFAVTEECKSPDWDGYGALPVSQKTLRMAFIFVNSLPLGTPAPTIGAEPDGSITFEWYRSLRQTLSVSVTPDAVLHYAALLGNRKCCGTEPLTRQAPRIILDLINDVDLVHEASAT